MARGGKRPGAGRKRQGEALKRQVTVTLSSEEVESLFLLRERGVDVNRAIGRELVRLAKEEDTE
jgi:hypothetical protein